MAVAENDDIYDLAGSERGSPRPRAPARAAEAAGSTVPAGATVGPPTNRPARTLGYARPGTVNSRTTAADGVVLPHARGAAADPMMLRREHRRRFVAPAALAIGGAVLFVATALILKGRDVPGAATWVGLAVLWDCAVIGVGLLVGSYFVDLETDSPRTLALQVAALVFTFAAIFWPIMYATSGTLCGFTSGWCLAVVVNCCLLAYFFELESVEALQLAAILFIVRLAANVAYLTTVGTFGYLP